VLQKLLSLVVDEIPLLKPAREQHETESTVWTGAEMLALLDRCGLDSSSVPTLAKTVAKLSDDARKDKDDKDDQDARIAAGRCRSRVSSVQQGADRSLMGSCRRHSHAGLSFWSAIFRLWPSAHCGATGRPACQRQALPPGATQVGAVSVLLGLLK
jgi:hypothetical protein